LLITGQKNNNTAQKGVI